MATVPMPELPHLNISNPFELVIETKILVLTNTGFVNLFFKKKLISSKKSLILLQKNFANPFFASFVIHKNKVIKIHS